MNPLRVETSSIHHKGLFATRDIQKGEGLFVVRGPTIHYTFEPNYRTGANWLQLRPGVWKMPLRDNVWNFINHSCEPNAGLQHSTTVVAMRPIAQGGEITIDYSTVEAGRTWRMSCRCGLAACRKTIRGIQFLPRDRFLVYASFISPYLQRIYLQEKTRTERVGGERRLFAKHPLKKGEVVCSVEGPMIAYTFAPDYRIGYRWLGVGKNKWIVPLRNNPWWHIRHSCEPNIAVDDQHRLIAMRTIAADEELTVDDAVTEVDPRWKRACHCGAPSCRGIVRSIQFLDHQRYHHYQPFLPSFIKRAYSARPLS